MNNNNYIKVIGKINEDYTLLLRSHADYVIAYKFDPETYTWGQGHYFDNLFEVSRFITKLDKHRPSYYRLEEIASVAINNLNSKCFDYFLLDADLSQEEANYFGIEKTIGWKEYSDEYEILDLEDC